MASNFTIEERIKYSFNTLSRDDILEVIEEIRNEKVKEFDQQVERENSIAWEQVEFARQILDEILVILEKETRSPKAIKSAILSILENSYFER